MAKGISDASADEVSADRLDAPVTCMTIVGRQVRYLVAGDDDGAIRIWDEK